MKCFSYRLQTCEFIIIFFFVALSRKRASQAIAVDLWTDQTPYIHSLTLPDLVFDSLIPASFVLFEYNMFIYYMFFSVREFHIDFL